MKECNLIVNESPWMLSRFRFCRFRFCTEWVQKICAHTNMVWQHLWPQTGRLSMKPSRPGAFSHTCVLSPLHTLRNSLLVRLPCLHTAWSALPDHCGTIAAFASITQRSAATSTRAPRELLTTSKKPSHWLLVWLLVLSSPRRILYSGMCRSRTKS